MLVVAAPYGRRLVVVVAYEWLPPSRVVCVRKETLSASASSSACSVRVDARSGTGEPNPRNDGRNDEGDGVLLDVRKGCNAAVRRAMLVESNGVVHRHSLLQLTKVWLLLLTGELAWGMPDARGKNITNL